MSSRRGPFPAGRGSLGSARRASASCTPLTTAATASSQKGNVVGHAPRRNILAAAYAENAAETATKPNATRWPGRGSRRIAKAESATAARSGTSVKRKGRTDMGSTFLLERDPVEPGHTEETAGAAGGRISRRRAVATGARPARLSS